MTSQQSAHPDPNSIPTLSIDRPGDALALVWHTFGELPEDSLVLIGLHGSSTGGHLRMDLSAALLDPRAGAERAANWLAGPEAEPAPHAVLGAVFTHQAAWGPKHQAAALIDQLRDLLDLRFGCPLLKTWHIGAGWVRDFDCPDPQCCPYPGSDAQSELDQALLRSPHLNSLPRPTSAAQTIETFLGVPLSPSAPDADQVAAAAGKEDRHRSTAASLGTWEASIREITDTGSCATVKHPQHTAQLLHSATDALLCQALPVLAAVGFDTAAANAPDILGAGRSESAHRSNAQEHGPREYAAALTGRLHHAPDWLRIEALDALLHLLIPYSGAQQLNLLALKGWIEWAKGSGSAAALAVDQCREEQPDHLLGNFFTELFNASGPCPWARVKLLSHGWWRSQRPV